MLFIHNQSSVIKYIFPKFLLLWWVDNRDLRVVLAMCESQDGRDRHRRHRKAGSRSPSRADCRRRSSTSTEYRRRRESWLRLSARLMTWGECRERVRKKEEKKSRRDMVLEYYYNNKGVSVVINKEVVEKCDKEKWLKLVSPL